MSHISSPLGALLCAAALFVAPAFSALAADAPNHAKGAEPLHLSHGETLALADFTVPGKITVFDFYSQYCPPCRAISPHLEKLHAARSDLAVVKIDINRPDHKGIDWTSPVARQYSLQSIPHFVIIGPDGKKQAEGDEAYEMISGWIDASEKGS